MFIILAASLFLTEPVPLEMPHASAFLVTQDGAQRLEDRYVRQDLWTSRTVCGRWMDDDGRVFLLARLDTEVPAIDGEVVETRLEYTRGEVPLAKRNLEARRAAIAALCSVEIAEKGIPPRRRLRGYKDIDYWQGTNETELVCAFLPEKADYWYLAVWELAAGDDFAVSRELFEENFLSREWWTLALACRDTKALSAQSERELLRADARHSVTNYAKWHTTDAPEFTVLDDLTMGRAFVTALTNEFRQMRSHYMASVPSPLNTSNTLCVARIFNSRDEYLDAIDEDMAWSAAYWSPARREIVAYLPDTGSATLMRTFRHEAFHQYLSYAVSMLTASPWFNEGYAEYFEDGGEELVQRMRMLESDALERIAERLPILLKMDYDAFYGGTDADRRLKYLLAESIIVFLEKGAPKVRFEPFKGLAADYVKALLKTHDMHLATEAVLPEGDRQTLFVREWLKYWKSM